MLMNGVLDFLVPGVGDGGRRDRGGVALRAGEPGHVLAEERRQRAHQLLGHLGRERMPAKLSRRAIRANESDAGGAKAEMIFQRLRALRGQRPLDVLAEQFDAFLAVLNGARQRVASWGGSGGGRVS